ncbi:Steroid 5-alpha-reductase det2 [Ancistrocladus abbreviatus]
MKNWSDQSLYKYSLLSLYLIGPPTIVALLFIQAPYGKHHRPGWGPSISPWLAWLLMESPTVFFTLFIYTFGQHRSNPRSLALLSVFLLHYVHRTCIYPLRLRKTVSSNPKTATGFPITIALNAFVFNLLNSYVQARWVSHYGDYEQDQWFWWRFTGGLVVFVTGMVMNVKSDLILVSLKNQGGGYKIPKGGWFELVSCANYFWEIVEWLGWAVITWSWAGFAFFLYTCANLIPRARANHKWYLEKFGEDYPRERKSVIPFLY